MMCNKQMCKIIVRAISIMLIIVGLSTNKVYAMFEYQEGQQYEVRLGNMYFRTLDEFINNQWVAMSDMTLEKPYKIEFLQPEITINNSYSNWYFAGQSGAIFTTASNDGQYPYRGEPGTKAVLKRGENYKGVFFQFTNGTYSYDNLTFDGGWNDDKSGIQAEGSFISLTGDSKLNITNCVMKNNYNVPSNPYQYQAKSGGAISSSGNSTIRIRDTKITNCAATYGGAMAIGNTNLNIDNVEISKCYSTATDGQAASAISANPTNNGYEMHINNLKITDCAAINAKENGAAIESTDFGVWHLNGVKIENNYSAGESAGFLQASGQGNISEIEIDGDIIIDNNYSGTIFNGYDIVSKDKESNLCVLYNKASSLADDMKEVVKVKINTNLTSNTKVGVTVIDHSIKTEDIVTFANADNSITGLENFFSDEDPTIKGKSSGNDTAIFGAQSQEPDLEEISTTKIVLKHLDKGNFVDTSKSHEYSLVYILDGNRIGEGFTLTNGQSYEFYINTGTDFEIKLVGENEENYDITFNVPEGNESIPVINIEEKSINGNINVKDAETTIVYTHSKEVAPATGITDNLKYIIIFLGIINLLVIVVSNIKFKDHDL